MSSLLPLQFCGPCVKITESLSKKVRDYICDDCTRGREGTDLYCLCRQPYQFYIGCEKCSEWYHGHCVGILQCEAEKNDECDPNSQYNRPNVWLRLVTTVGRAPAKRKAKPAKRSTPGTYK